MQHETKGNTEEEDTCKVKSEPVDDGPEHAPITPAPVKEAIAADREIPVEADPMNVDAPGQQLQLELRTAVKTGPIEISDDDEPPAKRPKVDPANKSTTIKMEPIEIDDGEPPIMKTKVEQANTPTTIKTEPVEKSDAPAKRPKAVDEDDDLERLEAEERKLAKEIEEEERLRSMKRKHEALLEKIEAAKARKAAK
jgi:hypothetical protein